MLRLSNPIAIPGRYFYDIGGRRLNNACDHTLYTESRALGEQLGYHEWYALMIHKMCLELPPGTCIGNLGDDTYVKRLTWKDIKGFIMAVSAVARAALKGEPVYVSQAEADRRAFICSDCRHNVMVSCGGCNGIILLANVFLLGRMCKGQDKLGACNLCGCWNAAKVWCSTYVLKRTVKVKKYPENCWNYEEASDA